MILVTGGSGRLGNNITKYLLEHNLEVHFTFNTYPCNIRGAPSHRLDATKKEETMKLIRKLRPEIVIHTIAVTDLELCETNRELAYRVNVDATKNIINTCEETQSKIVFISTSNLFDGNKEIYYEDDPPNPPNYYAFTKLIGENMLKASRLPFLILRTDQLYFWSFRDEKKTFVEIVLEKLKKHAPFEVFSDWYNTPTLIPDFSRVVYELILKNKPGVYHVVGPDYVSRYEWALRIADVFGYDKTLIQPTTSKKAQIKAKRSNAHLSNTKVIKELGNTILGVMEGLNFMKVEMSNVGRREDKEPPD